MSSQLNTTPALLLQIDSTIAGEASKKLFQQDSEANLGYVQKLSGLMNNLCSQISGVKAIAPCLDEFMDYIQQLCHENTLESN